MAESKRQTKKKKIDEVVMVADMGRQQPQATDFEQAVIGACLIEQEAFNQIADTLKPKSFYDFKHQLIFEAIQTLAAENQPVDILTVTEKLRSTGRLEDAGGVYYISELSQMVLSSAHIEHHAKVIADKALARDLITYTGKIQQGAFDPTQDVHELMQVAEGGLFELSKTNIKRDFTQIDPVIVEAHKKLQELNSISGLSGLASGFTDLDEITNGWQNSDLIIIAARPAMGKTAFVLSMARNIAITNHIPVAMFSLEMSNLQLVDRLISNVCEIPGDKLRGGHLADYEWGQLDVRLNEMFGAPLYVDDTPSLSVYELRTKARRLVREHQVRLIIIDYLQLMNASGMSFSSRQEEVSIISRSLKGLAKELQIPIIALSQLNRGIENRISSATSEQNMDTHRPQLADLRESGSIEQDADMVCMIHRPEYYKIMRDIHGVDLHGVAEIIIAKHRHGKTGDVRLKFESSYAKFLNMRDSTAPLPEQVVDRVYTSKMNASGFDDNEQFDPYSVDITNNDPPF